MELQPAIFCQVGDQMYVQPPGAMTVVASSIVSIQPLVLATAFNPHTVLGELLLFQAAHHGHCLACMGQEASSGLLDDLT